MKQTFYIVLICLLSACGKREAMTLMLQEAEQVMNARPDSALVLLQGIDEPDRLSEREYATYALLLTQANDKNHVEHTSDSLITVAINYFKKHNEPDRLAWSLYYDGIIHYELNEFLPSQTALLDAEAVATTISNHALLGHIYVSLGKLYDKEGLKDSVMPMFKKALREKTLAFLDSTKEYQRSLHEKKQAAALAAKLKEQEMGKLQQHNAELRWQREQFIYIGSIIVLFLSLLLFWGYRRHCRKLEEKENQLIHLEHLRMMKQVQVMKKEQQIAQLNRQAKIDRIQYAQLLAEKERLEKSIEKFKSGYKHLENEIKSMTKRNAHLSADIQKGEEVYTRLQAAPYTLNNEEWDELLSFTNAFHNDMFVHLSAIYSGLSYTEMQYCCLIYYNFSPKEITTIMNVSYDAVAKWKRRFKMRKENLDMNFFTILRSF